MSHRCGILRSLANAKENGGVNWTRTGIGMLTVIRHGSPPMPFTPSHTTASSRHTPGRDRARCHRVGPGVGAWRETEEAGLFMLVHTWRLFPDRAWKRRRKRSP